MKKVFCAVILFATFFPIILFAAAEENADTQACNYARQANDIKVWEAYLKKFPKGTCAFIAESELEKNGIIIPQAKKSPDEDACEIAKAKNSVDVWIAYLESYPKGVCAFQAKTAINELNKIAKEREDSKRSCDSNKGLFPCVDYATGYMWSKILEPGESCTSLNHGGFSDWYLPSLDVLETIMGKGSSKLGDTVWLWSSTSGRYNTDGTYRINFSNNDYRHDKYYDEQIIYARCVRRMK